MYKLILSFALSMNMFFNVQVQAACQADHPNMDIVEDTPSNAFTIDNATALHHLTSLIWDRCTLGQTWNGSDCTGSARKYTWKEALKEVKIINEQLYLGYSDWRIPNLNELESITENCGYGTAINLFIFPQTKWSISYLSSSSSVDDDSMFRSETPMDTEEDYPDFGWSISFEGGQTKIYSKSKKQLVRLVRSGQSFSSFKSDANNSDTTPDAFSFIHPTNIILNTLITSNSITITGINNSTSISINNGEYEINKDNHWLTTPSSVTNNQKIKVRQKSSATISTTTNAVLTIGGVSHTFSVSTGVMGDAHHDNIIDIQDVLSIMDSISIITPPSAPNTVADCDNNQTINIKDIVCVIDIILNP